MDWAQEDGPGILVRFRERPDRAAVEPLRDRYLEALVEPDGAARGQLVLARGHRCPRHAPPTGEDLGTVTDIFRTGGSEVFVVEGPRGEVLVPAVGAVMRGVRARRTAASWSMPRRSAWTTREPRVHGSVAGARRAPGKAREQGSRGRTAPATRLRPRRRAVDADATRDRGPRPRSIRQRRDAAHRRHHALPGPVPGAARGEHPGPGARSRRRASSWPTTCGRGAWAVTGASTTIPTAAAPGMLLRPEPVAEALDALAPAGSAQAVAHPARPGRPAVRPGARPASSRRRQHLVLVCPRYEGIDDRVRADGRPGAVHRRLRAVGRRDPGAGRHRCRPAPAARGHRRGVAGRGVVRRRACWSTPSTRGRRSSGAWRCRTCC